MAYGDKTGHFEHLKLPMTWAVMGVVALVCVVAALLFLGDRREEVDSSGYANRAGFDTVAGFPDKVLAYPVHKIGDGTNWFDDYFFAIRENRKLKMKVAELTQYRDLYIEEKDINTRYERLLNLRTEPPVETVTARSVAVSRGPFANNRLIDAGSNKKISFGNPVITDQGLVGRVVGVSPDVSRVLMVTDVTSHVPVMILRSDARAMMSGDGGGYPKLDFVRGKDSVRVGDQILSSGDGGVFPRGLPVGEAVKGVDNVWRVRLYSNRSAIDFVKVLLFKDFSQLPNADTILRAPPVSDVLPPPALPAVQPASSSATATSSSAAASSATTVRPAIGVTTSAASTSVVAKPKPKPVSPKPAATASTSAAASRPATSSAAAPVTPELKPYVPPSTPAADPSGQN
ncbi:rod shape-determining protein MreC [Asticcacaulis taihuensis]|uniref:rod shape-determining protein MreC n=1 Tax=Asticcacaulis taihuensis TaxID=260084 RepID=UPI003F7C978E